MLTRFNNFLFIMINDFYVMHVIILIILFKDLTRKNDHYKIYKLTLTYYILKKHRKDV